MPKPKRNLHATVAETTTPPNNLPTDHHIARIIKAAGNNLYDIESPSGQTFLVEMPSRFRNVIWVKRGSYVVVDTSALADRDNKLGGEIVNVVREEKQWRKMSYWPVEFGEKKSADATGDEDGSEEESTMGKMPPSESEDE